MPNIQTSHSKQKKDQVVAKALLNAARRLDITNVELSKVIGVSESTLSRMGDENYFPDNKKAFELAVLFIRLYRSLDTILAGDDVSSASWLRSANSALRAHPIDRIKTIEGLMDVLSYLDSRRAVI